MSNDIERARQTIRELPEWLDVPSEDGRTVVRKRLIDCTPKELDRVVARKEIEIAQAQAKIDPARH
jgi:hypothetical protein